MFKVGEKALVIVPPHLVPLTAPSLRCYHGTTVTVISSPMDRGGQFGVFYQTQAEDGHSFYIAEMALQKLPPQPTREDLALVSWEDCLWQPARLPEAA